MSLWPYRESRQLHGFTLIEVVVVIVLLGILAAVAIPRIFNSNDFYARGFHDETLGLLRYAQKTAIAQRRTVCVDFSSASSMSLKIAESAGSNSCSESLVGPNGYCRSGAERTACVTAKPGVAYAGESSPTSFNFDMSGQPVAILSGDLMDNNLIIQVRDVRKIITVESVTGYVHD
jgi:MSHA pilin protein MshC